MDTETAEYRYGPEIDEEIVTWLESGAKFPPELLVKLGGGEVRTYEILDRDDAGVISILRNQRRGKKGFVLKVRDRLSQIEYAAKLAIPDDYKTQSPLSELEFGKLLHGARDLFLAPTYVGRVARFPDEPTEGNRQDWICFISDWLKGQTLGCLVETSPEKITPSLTVGIAKDLITAVLYMEGKGLKHDDLNLGNIMLEDADKELARINPGRAQPNLRIIDLGSMKYADRVTAKADDDWSLTAKCLAELYNVMHRQRDVASQYSKSLELFRCFIKALSDDHDRHFPDVGDYIRHLDDIEKAILIGRQSREFSLFEGISAENLADDTVLLDLFVKHLSWIALVREPGPCVLIGPRGCGKSMVFRYMAARTQLASPEIAADGLKTWRLFGIYIGCSSDLGNDLLWLKQKGADFEQHAPQVVDYFNLVAARELMRALSSVARGPQIASELGVTDSAKRRLSDFIQSMLPLDVLGIQLNGLDPLQSCAEGLDRLRVALGRDMRSGKCDSLNTGVTFVRELCSKLVELMPGFKGLPITFLLDDYTEHRISAEVQSVLNEIVFHRAATHAFKISSEPYGFFPTSFHGARIDVNREYQEIDAGVKCLEISSADRKKFVTDLLDKRLEEAKYVGRAGTLIGESTLSSDRALAEEIRNNRKGKQTYYNGLDVLANAWSGDVANILHILRNMFADAGIGPTSNSRINDDVQHTAIVRVSKGLRSRISAYTPLGKEMNEITSAFGDMALRLLVDYDSKARTDPDKTNRKYRIEWTLPEGATVESELVRIDPSREFYRLYKELIRRALFHESLESRGKEGPGRRTVRLQIRSSLLPSFGTSLLHKNHLKIDRVEEFVEFLGQTKRWAAGQIANYRGVGGLFEDTMGDEGDDQ